MSVNNRMNLSHFHVINKPLDAIETVRERSISGDVDDDPFYICNISDIIRKHRNWQQCMPRIIPFYGKYRESEAKNHLHKVFQIQNKSFNRRNPIEIILKVYLLNKKKLKLKCCTK